MPSLEIRVRARANYEDGFKYCSKCGLFYKVGDEQTRCPNCGSILRSKPRTRKKKRLYPAIGGGMR